MGVFPYSSDAFSTRGHNLWDEGGCCGSWQRSSWGNPSLSSMGPAFPTGIIIPDPAPP